MQELTEDAFFHICFYLPNDALFKLLESVQVSVDLIKRLCVDRNFPIVDNITLFKEFLTNDKFAPKYAAKTFDIEFLDRVVIYLDKEGKDWFTYIIEGVYNHGRDFIYEVYSRFLSKDILDAIIKEDMDTISSLNGDYRKVLETYTSEEVYGYISFAAYSSEKSFLWMLRVNEKLHPFWSILAILGDKPNNIRQLFFPVDEQPKVEKWLAKVGSKECLESYIEDVNNINFTYINKYKRVDLVSRFLLSQIEVSLSKCEQQVISKEIEEYLQEVRLTLTK